MVIYVHTVLTLYLINTLHLACQNTTHLKDPLYTKYVRIKHTAKSSYCIYMTYNKHCLITYFRQTDLLKGHYDLEYIYFVHDYVMINTIFAPIYSYFNRVISVNMYQRSKFSQYYLIYKTKQLLKCFTGTISMGHLVTQNV